MKRNHVQQRLLPKNLMHKRPPQKNLMQKRPLQAKLLKLQWFKRPCSSLKKKVKQGKMQRWGNLPTQSTCSWVGTPMPLENQRVMRALFAEADCCFCFFCWDYGGLRLCEE
ncbi:hypothetical protein Tc00.1047053478463.10 [Trypanosoma cruzi]|uniref:Uncharacterized protein n=1 Tax=Trypanosoma cruzi (strain CL Brener) TaxID=353153 RepID=Q4CL01_TRYCC|nr:hypothetical protein Tc00.1047053478463.10 [Trypanosoma cruzi]EAN80953.1 hypothetical protein Tc00.1047053478463.10 [Trypanosoma cruzi]|eukprot:XP_802399.1 hypothetical protein [Trypanosoma cruzi strain CL Brener]